MADAQAEQHAREGLLARAVDGRHELLREHVSQRQVLALAVDAVGDHSRQLVFGERVEVGHVHQAPLLVEPAHYLVAHALDVQRAAARPMQQPLERLRRAVDGDAAVSRLSLLAHHGAAAARALMRHLPHQGIVGAQGQHRAHYLGYHVAGLAHHHRVAHAHVLAMHLVHVVQRGAGHGRACHGHRLHLGHRGQRAGAAHLHGYVAQDGGLLLRRELERDGPSRRAGREAHALLKREGIHLHHHAVYLIGQLFATVHGRAAEAEHLVEARAQRHVRVHMEARLAQPLQQIPLALHRQRSIVGRGVDERCQVAPGGYLRVLLAQRSRRGVARVGEGRLAVVHGSAVERLEAALGHVHLAAQLQRGAGAAHGPAGLLAQGQRHVAHGAHVGGHVLAGGAVAARGGAHEHALVVGERDGRAVYLQLAAQRRQLAEGLLHALGPGGQLVEVHGVVERVHAARVVDGHELLAHVAAHPLGGARRIHQFGMKRLQLAQLAHERIEGAVGYLGVVQRVVLVGVVLYLLAQRSDARSCIARCRCARLLVKEALLLGGHRTIL